MIKKDCIAMILAGGQGSRLGILTKNLAKPAVPFGGKYRIIDFTLSNCGNSDIDTVGVLTQYKPLVLNTYIGIGRPWNLDRKNGGVTVLPPFVKEEGGEWYKGTGNAIYQNIDFIDQYSPDNILILSGDHIYKMDYNSMLDAHRAKNADITISAIEVPWFQAHRFGIMNTDPAGYIVKFEEKPVNPKNNLASMGIYIFKWPLLKKYLLLDEQNSTSSHDFGKNVLPAMLQNNEKLYAYLYSGYWKDVGTIESFWEANMDLLSDHPELDLYDRDWPIYSVNPTQPPNYIASNAKIRRSLINEGCVILGEVENAVIFPGVFIGKNAKVRNSVIMPNVKIGTNVCIEKAIIGENTRIRKHSFIGCNDLGDFYYGGDPSTGKITVVGENMDIPQATILSNGAMVSL